MNEKQIEEEEYVYQHFEITAKLYVLYLKLNVTESIGLLFDNLKKRFEEEGDADGFDLSAAREKVNAAVAEGVQTIEGVAKQFFSIPDNVLLLPDDTQKYTKDDIKVLKAELERYQEHYMKQKTYIALLEKELHDLEKVDLLNQNVNRLLQTHKEMHANRVSLKNAAKDVDKLQITKEIRNMKFTRYICDESKPPKLSTN